MDNYEQEWIAVTHRPKNAKVILKTAGVYYKHDKPGGIGCTLDGEGLEEELKKGFTLYQHAWEHASSPEREHILDDYMVQIVDACTSKPSDGTHAMLLVLNMIYLVSAGRIHNDEYNGTLFLWQGPNKKRNRG